MSISSEQLPANHLVDYEKLFVERVAYGKPLEKITTALIGHLAQYDGVKIWGLPSESNNSNPHVSLMGRKEFIQNRSIINPAMLRNSAVQDRLFRRVPSLLNVRKVVGMALLVQKKNGEHFVELAFRGQDGETLLDERNQLWGGLANLNGVDGSELDWRQHLRPRLELAYAREGSVPDTIAADLKANIEPFLPSVIHLAPVVFPRPLTYGAS